MREPALLRFRGHFKSRNTQELGPGETRTFRGPFLERENRDVDVHGPITCSVLSCKGGSQKIEINYHKTRLMLIGVLARNGAGHCRQVGRWFRSTSKPGAFVLEIPTLQFASTEM